MSQEKSIFDMDRLKDVEFQCRVCESVNVVDFRGDPHNRRFYNMVCGVCEAARPHVLFDERFTGSREEDGDEV